MKKPSEISDYNERLGLGKNPDEKEIKSTYRKLALIYHPDKNPIGKKKESELEFIAISEAYESLIGKSNGREKDFGYYENSFYDNFKEYEEIFEMMKKSDSYAIRKIARITEIFVRGGMF